MLISPHAKSSVKLPNVTHHLGQLEQWSGRPGHFLGNLGELSLLGEERLGFELSSIAEKIDFKQNPSPSDAVRQHRI
jgi:hypothetical protein